MRDLHVPSLAWFPEDSYHAVRPFARPWQDQSQAGGDAYAGTAVIPAGILTTPQGEVPAQPGEEPHSPGTGGPVPTENGPASSPDPGT